MLISIAVSIATPYYIVRKKDNEEARVFAYPVERVIWLICGLLNIGELIFKVIVYFEGMVENEKKK
jgi:Ni,Fe-hydrogenase I cytochrome b subunit